MHFLSRVRLSPKSKVLRVGFLIVVVVSLLFVALPLEMGYQGRSLHDGQGMWKQVAKVDFNGVSPTQGFHRHLTGQGDDRTEGSSQKTNLLSPSDVILVVTPDKVVEGLIQKDGEGPLLPSTSKKIMTGEDALDFRTNIPEPPSDLPESEEEKRSTEKRDVETGRKTSKAPSVCPKLGIAAKFPDVLNRGKKIRCLPHQSAEKACVLAAELYAHRGELEHCLTNKERHEICIIKEVTVSRNFEITFMCHPDVCLREEGETIAVSILNPKKGEVEVIERFKDAKRLETQLKYIAAKTHAMGYNFFFLDCAAADNTLISSKSQLVILPPRVPKLSKFHAPRKSSASKPVLDINVILIDSVARAHFYRSLPRTVELFNRLNAKIGGAEVLDFELFQAVDGHSAENFHSFFSGKLMPRHLKASEKEGYPVEHSALYKPFKDAGYHTTYMDDLCWDEVWGLRLDLGNAGTFQKMAMLVKKNYIDDTGLTFASCKILKHNGVSTPFNGPDNDQVCYNGLFHHQYLLQYLVNLYTEHPFLAERVPRFSFTVLDTAHDYGGRRIQTLDHGLPAFLQRMSQLKNTLTIVLADHGNTYTEYTHAVLEGRFEMFHPMLFMIVPEKVAASIGKRRMANLRANQKRLITIIDLHNTLKTVALEAQGKPSVKKGLFDLMPSKRLCDDLTLNLPNLCVCDGWDTATHNDTTQVGVVDFALGTLNNMIHLQRTNGFVEGKSQWLPSNNCMRLVPLSFYNVRERNSGEHLVTTLDFTVEAGRGAIQKVDVFHVEVESFIHPKSRSRNMKLLNFDRISQYGKYRACVDSDVNVKLCVCDITAGQSSIRGNEVALIADTFRRQISFMNARIRVEHQSDLPCLYTIIREYEDKEKENAKKRPIHAAGFEVLNICKALMFKVTVHDSGSNLKQSRSLPAEQLIGPFGVTYIATSIRDVPYWSSDTEASFTFA